MTAPLGVPAETSTVEFPAGSSTLNDPPIAMMWNGHRHFGVQVVLLAPEDGCGRDVDDDVEIAGRAAGRAVLAFAMQAQSLPVGDAGRECGP